MGPRMCARRLAHVAFSLSSKPVRRSFWHCASFVAKLGAKTRGKKATSKTLGEGYPRVQLRPKCGVLRGNFGEESQ
jgi:hypothetical protein